MIVFKRTSKHDADSFVYTCVINQHQKGMSIMVNNYTYIDRDGGPWIMWGSFDKRRPTAREMFNIRKKLGT